MDMTDAVFEEIDSLSGYQVVDLVVTVKVLLSHGVRFSLLLSLDPEYVFIHLHTRCPDLHTRCPPTQIS
jgi:hypothetical protein